MALYQQLRNEEESVSINLNPPAYQEFSPGHRPLVPLQTFPPLQQQQSSVSLWNKSWINSVHTYLSSLSECGCSRSTKSSESNASQG